MIYLKGKDRTNKDLIYDPEIDFQVMMEWEKPYIKKLIKNLKPTGHVLEIGFGLGYSASEIQKYNIKSHTIIEPVMMKQLKEWSKKQKHKVNIVQGYWQEVLKTLDKFDTIFFDDAPSKKFTDLDNIRIYKFFYLMLNNHVNKNAKMSWYCDVALRWLSNPAAEFTIKPIKIKIPKHCEYVKGDTLYLPLIKFNNGIVKDNIHLGLNKELQVIPV